MADRVVTLRRGGIGGTRIVTLATAAMTILVWATVGPLYAAVPAALTLLLGRALFTPPPSLTLGDDGTVTIADPATLKEPLRAPAATIAGGWHGPGVVRWLHASMGSVGPLPVPIRAEYGFDLGPSKPDAVLAFDPPLVPAATKRAVVARGARAIPPMSGQAIDRLWLTFADRDDAVAAFAAWGRPLDPVEEGDGDQPFFGRSL